MQKSEGLYEVRRGKPSGLQVLTVNPLKIHSIHQRKLLYNHSGDDEVEDPPVPIPNTEVKLYVAESTCRDTDREDMELPDFKKEQL